MADNSGLIVNALEKTNPILFKEVDGNGSWQTTVRKRGARVRLFRKYERGDHRADITTEMRKMLRLNTDDAELKEFNDNYMRVVVDKMASRILVSNISIDEKNKNWLEETLLRNKFQSQQTTWFRGAVRDGDSFVITDTETGQWISEPAYDGFSGLVAIFDNVTKNPIWACKLWSISDESILEDEETTSTIMKIVVYQPNKISYWLGREGASEVAPNLIPLEDLGNGFAEAPLQEGNEVPWPLGYIPIVQFANQADNYTQYGESELRPAIPLQDALNRTIHSMVMASEFSAFKLLWSIGFEVDVDGIVPGSVINLVLKDEGGNILTSMNKEQADYLRACRVGQFQESDISQYTTQIDKFVQQISQATQTPIYGITTQSNLSGEALKQLEIGLLGKIERFQQQNEDSIAKLIRHMADIQNKFETGTGNAPEVTDINVIWKDAEILNVDERIATLTELRSKAPGLFTDDFYIKRIGVLIKMTQKDIEAEIEASKTQSSLFLESLTGAGGGTPVA